MVTYGIAAAVWFLSLVGDASATNFKECRSFFNKKVGSLPLNVTLSNCDKYPCDLARGSEIYGGMDFIYDKDLSVLIPKITVYLVGFPLSWPINQKDGCTSLTLNKCPIKAGTTARYEYSLFLGPLIPLVQPMIRFELRNEHGDTAICLEIPIRIISNPNENHSEKKRVESSNGVSCNEQKL